MRSLDGYERKQNLPEIFYCSPQPPDTNLIKISPFVSEIRRTDKYKLHIMHSLDAFGHRAHKNSMPSSGPLFRQTLTFIRRGVTTCYKSDVDEINQILFTVLRQNMRQKTDRERETLETAADFQAEISTSDLRNTTRECTAPRHSTRGNSQMQSLCHNTGSLIIHATVGIRPRDKGARTSRSAHPATLRFSRVKLPLQLNTIRWRRS
jgi:hypothetical protein